MLDNNKRLLPPLWWRWCPVPWWPGPGECSCSEGTSCSPWPWTCSPLSPARAAADWAPGPATAALKWWNSSQPELEPRAHWAEAFLEVGTMSPPARGRQVTSHVSRVLVLVTRIVMRNWFQLRSWSCVMSPCVTAACKGIELNYLPFDQ